MKCLSLRSLTILAAFLSISTAISDDVQDLFSGCTPANKDDQHLKFFANGVAYEMWIPTDGKAYNVGKPAAELQCNVLNPTPTNQGCVPCWDKMNFVQVIGRGPCSFLLTDNDNKLFTVDVDNDVGVSLYPMSGHLGLATCNKPKRKLERDIEAPQLICPDTQGSKVTLTTGSQKYVLSVPADMTTYDVIGPDSKLGCIGPIGYKYSMCQACNFPVQLIETSVEAGLCAFNISGYSNIVYVHHESGPLPLSTTSQIFSVTCGHDYRPLRPRNLSTAPQPAPVACPAWRDNATISFMSDSFEDEVGRWVAFDLQIRPDGTTFQLDKEPYGVGCLRRDKLYTDQCFPCTMCIADMTVPDGITCHFTAVTKYGQYFTFTMYGLTEVTTGGGYKLVDITCHRNSTSEERSALEMGPRDMTMTSESWTIDSVPKHLNCVDRGENHSISFRNSDGFAGCIYPEPDMQYYSLSGNKPQLRCNFFDSETFTPGNPTNCADWTFEYIQVHESLEECRFRFEGHDEVFVWSAQDRTTECFDPPVRPLGVQCGFGKHNNPPRTASESTYDSSEGTVDTLPAIGDVLARGMIPYGKDTQVRRKSIATQRSSAQPQIEPFCDPGDGTIHLKLSNGSEHFIRVPADSFVWPVFSPGQEGLGCSTDKEEGCFECGVQYTHVSISATLKNCVLWSHNRHDNIIVSAEKADLLNMNNVNIISDGIDLLVCGFPWAQVNEYMFPVAQHASDITRRSPVIDSVANLLAPTSADARCQGLDHKVSIVSQDGNIYFVPVPLDYKFHPMHEMFCVRMSDAACVPCNQIGAAVSVNTAIQWGPCIFFSEDHRAIFTQYWNPTPDSSQVTPPTPFEPAGVISGIECGSGA